MKKDLSVEVLKRILFITGGVLLVVIVLFCFEVYLPLDLNSHSSAVFVVEKGWGDGKIAKNLEEAKIIKSSFFFKFYVALSLKHSTLQAGKYNLSPKMSIHEIANKMAYGQVAKNNLVILEGWDEQDMEDYLKTKNICEEGEFVSLTKKDYSAEFSFLADKPKNLGLGGYLFPDTYEVAEAETCQNVVEMMLSNFDKKLDEDLRVEILKQKKSIFDIVTMASLIEKEVRTLEDKKIVSGILWKRIKMGMPLQLDCTINYITGKNDPSASIKDTKIDSPYNTYLYYGLPQGPISNPGMGSIRAAIYPEDSEYLYYLSDGKTFFSKTFEDHIAAKIKYLQ